MIGQQPKGELLFITWQPSALTEPSRCCVSERSHSGCSDAAHMTQSPPPTLPLASAGPAGTDKLSAPLHTHVCSQRMWHKKKYVGSSSQKVIAVQQVLENNGWLKRCRRMCTKVRDYILHLTHSHTRGPCKQKLPGQTTSHTWSRLPRT